MRNQSIDCVKALAAILMVYGHLIFSGSYADASECVRNQISFICSFHMPVFAVASGMFFSTKRPVLNFVGHKSLQLFLPLFMWTSFSWFFYPIVSDLLLGYDIHLFATCRNVVYGLFVWQNYWFISSLYPCFLYGYIVKKIFKSDISLIGSVLILWIISWFEIIPNRLDTVCGMTFLYPFFVFGYFLHVYKSRFIVYRLPLAFISLAFYVVLILLFWRGLPDTWYVMNTGIFAEAHPVCGVTGIMVVWKTLSRFLIGASASVFLLLSCEWLFDKIGSSDFQSGKAVLSHLSDIGKYTLPVYLLSGRIQGFFEEWLGDSWYANIIDTILIVYLCYFVAVFTCKNKWLGLFLWGKTFQRKSLRR